MITTALIFAAGYVACILFPMPGVSRWVLDAWGKAYARIKG